MRGIPNANGHASDPIPHREASHTPPGANFTAAREEHHDTAEPVQITAPPTFEREPSGAIVNVNVHQPAPVQQRSITPPAPTPAPPPVPTIAAPSLAPPIDPNPELAMKYGEAQSEIQRLRALLAAVPDPSSVASASSGTSPTELRRRHRGPTSDDGTTMVSSSETGTYVEELSAEGVPLQVVIIIAVMVFITTYLFF